MCSQIYIFNNEHLNETVDTIMNNVPLRYWETMFNAMTCIDDTQKQIPKDDIIRSICVSDYDFENNPCNAEYIRTMHAYGIPIYDMVNNTTLLYNINYNGYFELLQHVKTGAEWVAVMKWISSLIEKPYRARNMYRFIAVTYEKYMTTYTDGVTEATYSNEILENITKMLRNAREQYDIVSDKIELYDAKCDALKWLHDRYVPEVYTSMSDDIKSSQYRHIKHIQQCEHFKNIIDVMMKLQQKWDEWVDIPPLVSPTPDMPPSPPRQAPTTQEQIDNLTSRLNRLRSMLRH